MKNGLSICDSQKILITSPTDIQRGNKSATLQGWKERKKKKRETRRKEEAVEKTKVESSHFYGSIKHRMCSCNL